MVVFAEADPALRARQPWKAAHERDYGWLSAAEHPTLARGYLDTAYRPMVELLDYLAANGFSNYIASGGGRDFMRPIKRVLQTARDGWTVISVNDDWATVF